MRGGQLGGSPGCLLLISHCPLLVIHCPLFFTFVCCFQSIVCQPLSTVHCLPFIICCLSSVIHCLPSIICSSLVCCPWSVILPPSSIVCCSSSTVHLSAKWHGSGWWWWWCSRGGCDDGGHQERKALFVDNMWCGKHPQTSLDLPVRVYPYPCSRVGIYVGSEIPYPYPYPPNPYPHTPGVSETLAQHYSQNLGRTKASAYYYWPLVLSQVRVWQPLLMGCQPPKCYWVCQTWISEWRIRHTWIEEDVVPNSRYLLDNNCKSSEASHKALVHIQNPENDQCSPWWRGGNLHASKMWRVSKFSMAPLPKYTFLFEVFHFVLNFGDVWRPHFQP